MVFETMEKITLSVFLAIHNVIKIFLRNKRQKIVDSDSSLFFTN